MQALKVVAEGAITSFRYPHFMWQKHPTFEMPPPATIYGHICSAVGDWIDPRGIRFAYHFTYEGKVEDLEHIHAGGVMPFHRDLLFRPRLTLYLNRPDLLPAFRSPHYAVILGRSQDLFTYTSVKTVTLEEADRAFYEHTLLPYEMATRVMRGVVVQMPRFVDYTQHRNATFARYVMLHGKIVSSPDETQPGASGLLRYPGDEVRTHWIDSEVRNDKGLALGLAWHSFVEDTDGSAALP
jgi:CRISPR-associated protein Cas5t